MSSHSYSFSSRTSPAPFPLDKVVTNLIPVTVASGLPKFQATCQYNVHMASTTMQNLSKNTPIEKNIYRPYTYIGFWNNIDLLDYPFIIFLSHTRFWRLSYHHPEIQLHYSKSSVAVYYSTFENYFFTSYVKQLPGSRRNYIIKSQLFLLFVLYNKSCWHKH